MSNDFTRGVRVYLETSGYAKGINELVQLNEKLNKEYGELKSKADQLSASEQKRLKQLETQIKKNAQTEVDYRKKLKETEDVLKNLSGKSYNDLLAARNHARNELRKAIKGTEEYNARLEVHKRLTKEVAKAEDAMSVAVGCQSNVFGKVTGFVNKYWAVLAGGISLLTGVSMTFRKLSEDVAKMDDVYSDVIKTTNMTKQEVLALNEEFKKMDTRTSRESLNNLARDAGKLGIEGSKNILDFVDAGNQINVALGEDLGEDAIKNIGKMVGVFDKSTKHLQELDLKGKMLAVGSAINQLGASSSANEDYLVQFAGRLGGVASQAGISIDAILGFGSALDQDMQQVEMSATALQNFIMKIMGEPAKFAKIAGMDVKKFTDLLSTDANAAIKEVLRSLNSKGGFQQLIPIFNEMGLDGARAVGVLSAMASSIGKIDEAQRVANQAMVEGTSVTKEYSTKNENLQAKLDKARKDFKEVSLQLGENLNPMLLKTTKLTTYFIKVLAELAKHPEIVYRLVAAFTAYMVVMNKNYLIEKATQVLNFIKITSLKLRIAITNQATAAELRLVGAQDALNASMKKNLWGIIAAAIAFALVYLIEYLKKTNEATEANKILSNVKEEQTDLIKQNTEAVAKEKTELNNLVTAITQTNENQDLRSRLIDQLNEKYPGFISFIDKEKVTNELLAAALADVNEQYSIKLKNAALTGKAQAYDNASVKAMQRQIEIEEELKNLRADVTKDNTKRIKQLEDEDSQLSRNIKSYQAASNTYKTTIQENNKELERMNTSAYYRGEMKTWSDALTDIQNKVKSAQERKNNEEISFYNEQIQQASANYNFARAKYDEMLKKENSKPDAPKPTSTYTPAEKDKKDNSKKTDPFEEELKALDNLKSKYILWYTEKMAMGTTSEKEFNEIMTELDTQFLEDKLALQKKYGKDTLQTALDILQNEIKQKKSADEEMLRLLQQNADARSKNTDAWETFEKEKLQDKVDFDKITEQQYQRELIAIELTANEERLRNAEAYAAEVKATKLFDHKQQEKLEKESVDAVTNAQKAVERSQKAVNKNKLKEEKDFQEKRKQLLEKYGIKTQQQVLKRELLDLKKALKEKLLTEEEYQIARRQVIAKYAVEAAGIAVEVAGGIADAVSAYHQMEADSLEAQKQRELAAAGDNADKRHEIEQAYAQKELNLRKKQANSEMMIKIAQAVAAGAHAVANVWEVHAANPILAGILSAAAVATVAFQVASIKKQRNAIMATTLDSSSDGNSMGKGALVANSEITPTVQHEKGSYDVIGADDGKTYRNVPYRGVARTGIYNSPALVAESGEELIIDNPTLRNIRMNAPEVLSAIRRMRVRQYAIGNYEAVNNMANVTQNTDKVDSSGLIVQFISLMDELIPLLRYLKENGIDAFVLLSELERKQALRDKSLKIGSK